MRVILLHPFDAFSGSQRVAATLARAISDSNLHLEFHLGFGTRGFVSSCLGVRQFLGVDHIPSRMLLYPLWILAMWPRMIMAAISGDVVWANTVYSIAPAIPMVLLAPRRLVIHAHELEFPSLIRILMTLAVRRKAQILGVSRLHVQRLGVPAEVLPNCVDVSSDLPPRELPTVIYVGMASALKGFPLFVEVARRLPSDRVRRVAYLPSRPVAAESLLKDAEEAEVELKIGYINPLDIYPGASLLLQCTDSSLWTETFSLVMAEALACGVPVATTGMAVAAEVLGDAWAFDVADRDPSRIVAEIERLLASPDRLVGLRVAAKHQREQFTYKRFRTNVFSIIKQAGSSVNAAERRY